MSIVTAELPRLSPDTHLVDSDGNRLPSLIAHEIEVSVEFDHPRFNTDDQGAALVRAAVAADADGGDHADLSENTPAKDFMREAFGDVCEFSVEGQRDYVDIGHPEKSTSERTDFEEAGKEQVIGLKQLAELYAGAAKKIREKSGDNVGVRMLANNSDGNGNAWMYKDNPEGNGNSWSNHTNVLIMRAVPWEDIVDTYAGHFCSMPVFCGGGSVRRGNSEYGDFHWWLSERAPYFYDVTGPATIGRYRTLINSRDKPLANFDKYRRLHCIIGDTLFSVPSIAARAASIALIARGLEWGKRFRDLRPVSPLRSVRTISSDPTLTRRIRVESGKCYTGVEHQLEYADRILDDPGLCGYLTKHELEWGERWRTILHNVRENPFSAASMRDMQWPVRLLSVMKDIKAKRERGSKSSDFVVAFHKSAHFTQLLPEEGMGMNLVRRRFFNNSPTAEELENGLPVANTRAMLRGDAIRQLQEHGIKFGASWDHILLFYPTISAVPDSDSYFMKDPYATEDQGLQRMIDDAIAQTRKFDSQIFA